MKQKKQIKKSVVFLLIVNALFAVAGIILIIAWGCSLNNTCLLWIDGPFLGWVQLLIIALVFGGMLISPAFIVCADQEIYF